MARRKQNGVTLHESQGALKCPASCVSAQACVQGVPYDATSTPVNLPRHCAFLRAGYPDPTQAVAKQVHAADRNPLVRGEFPQAGCGTTF